MTALEAAPLWQRMAGSVRSPTATLWSSVTKKPSLDECWLWRKLNDGSGSKWDGQNAYLLSSNLRQRFPFVFMTQPYVMKF